MRWAGHIAIRRGDRRSQLETFKDTVASSRPATPSSRLLRALARPTVDSRTSKQGRSRWPSTPASTSSPCPSSTSGAGARDPPRAPLSPLSTSRDHAFGSQVSSDGARAHRAPARRGDSRAPSRQDCRPEGGRRPLRSLRGGQQRSPYRPASVAGGRGVELAQACRPPRACC